MEERKMKGWMILLFVGMFGIACKKSEKQLEASVQTDVNYNTAALNKADVYLPQNRSNRTGVVILVHGGYWYGGDKTELSSYATQIQAMGYAVVNMNYRLVDAQSTIKLDQQLQDIQAVRNFIANHVDEWNVGNKIAMLGVSAGAHLSMLYSYSNPSDEAIKTVISVAGPTNLTDNRNITPNTQLLVQQLLGVSPTQNPQKYVDASPYFRLSAQAKPTLLVHGRKDVVVPIQQAIDLKTKLDQLNVKNEMVVYEDAGHEVVNASNQAEVMLKLQNWLKLYLD